jgi:hypothetical protein
MDEGYVLDRGESNRRLQETWVEGPPEPSFWTGLKTKGRKVLAVTTWRCRDCGLLESYAN